MNLVEKEEGQLVNEATEKRIQLPIYIMRCHIVEMKRFMPCMYYTCTHFMHTYCTYTTTQRHRANSVCAVSEYFSLFSSDSLTYTHTHTLRLTLCPSLSVASFATICYSFVNDFCCHRDGVYMRLFVCVCVFVCTLNDDASKSPKTNENGTGEIPVKIKVRLNPTLIFCRLSSLKTRHSRPNRSRE